MSYLELKHALPTKRDTLRKQLHAYILVGAAAALIDYGCLFCLIKANINYVIANTIAFSIANVFNFVAGHYVVFADTARHDRLLSSYMAVLTISIAGLVINDIVLFVSVNIMTMHIWLGKTLATIIGFGWNFSARKLWVYK